MLSLLLSLDEEFKLRREPSIITRGFIYAIESHDLLQNQESFKTLAEYVASTSNYNKKI